jgi:hypothetical protein
MERLPTPICVSTSTCISRLIGPTPVRIYIQASFLVYLLGSLKDPALAPTGSRHPSMLFVTPPCAYVSREGWRGCTRHRASMLMVLTAERRFEAAAASILRPAHTRRSSSASWASCTARAARAFGVACPQLPGSARITKNQLFVDRIGMRKRSLGHVGRLNTVV